MQTISEVSVRRLATAAGYAVHKSRTRDPDRTDFGGFMLIDPDTNFAVLGGSPYCYSSDLDKIQQWLAT